MGEEDRKKKTKMKSSLSFDCLSFVFGFWFLVFGFWSLVFGLWVLVFGHECVYLFCRVFLDALKGVG